MHGLSQLMELHRFFTVSAVRGCTTSASLLIPLTNLAWPGPCWWPWIAAEQLDAEELKTLREWEVKYSQKYDCVGTLKAARPAAQPEPEPSDDMEVEEFEDAVAGDMAQRAQANQGARAARLEVLGLATVAEQGARSASRTPGGGC